MKQHLGRELESDECVHHEDRRKDNNDINNLAILSSSEHSELHAKEKRNGFEKTSLYTQKDTDATWLKIRCPECGRVFYKRKSLARGNKSGKYFCCARCATVYIDRDVEKSAVNVICEFHASTKLMNKVLLDPFLEVDDNGVVCQRSYS